MSDPTPVPWWAGLRAVPLAFLAVPFVPALFLALAGGHGRLIGGCVAGIAGVVLATARLRRARRRDNRAAAALLGVGTGLAAGFAGGTGPIGGVVLGLMAFAGARFLYAGRGEATSFAEEWGTFRDRFRSRLSVRPAAPAEPPPTAAPTRDPTRDRLVALRFADARLLGAVEALDRLHSEVAAHPRQGMEARRVLLLGVDGLERIAGRLGGGVAPPANLPDTLDDLAKAADGAAHGLRAAETEALEIQVKVLRDRLHEEGRV